jgi:threonine synthase
MSIWNSKLIDSDFSIKLTMGEGNTPVEEHQVEGIKALLKREDMNPNGSFKDRSIAYQLSKHISDGVKKFCISSSGNAAISAYAYSKLIDISLDIFVSSKLSSEKLAKLEGAKLHISDNPKSDCIKFSGETGSLNLRGSVDDNAYFGYYSLAEEISELDIDSIFIPTSSGNAALGLHQGLKKLGNHIPIYIVQTTKVCPIASLYDKEFTKTDSSVVTCITDRVCKRKDQIIDLIKDSCGSGIVISDEEVLEASKKDSLPINSSVSIAGFTKALKKGYTINRPLLVISGS